MLRFFLVGLFLVFLSNHTVAQVYPKGFRKISMLTGGLTLPISPGANFGIESSAIGDLDDDGVIDLAVGSNNQNGVSVGAMFILFMNTNGTVKSAVQINSTEPPSKLDAFGTSVCALGDLDDDGVEDIGVGAGFDSDDGYRSGAFWVIFMKKDGTVKRRQKVSNLAGNFGAPIQKEDVFGTGAGTIGDLDGDGNMEIVVGSRKRGIAYILFLKNNGMVKKYKAISSAQGLPIDPDGLATYRVAGLGDVNGDGVPDLGVGAHRSDVAFVDSGVVFVVFLTREGDVKGFTEISSGISNFNDPKASLFGVGLVAIGDHNNDGVPDIVVAGDDSDSHTGAIWYLMLKRDGTVKSHYKISSKSGNRSIKLRAGDFFGSSISFLGDLNRDGINDIAVAAMNDDDGGDDNGAIWISVPAR
jgi:hypothetical protein